MKFVQPTVPQQTTSADMVGRAESRSAMFVVLLFVASAVITAALTSLASLAHRMFKVAFKFPRAVQ
jgi:hypothetical protein